MADVIIEFPYQFRGAAASTAPATRPVKAAAPRNKNHVMPAHMHRLPHPSVTAAIDSALSAGRKPAQKRVRKAPDDLSTKPDVPWSQFTILHLREFLPAAPARFSMPDLVAALCEAAHAGWIVPVADERIAGVTQRLCLQGVINRQIQREAIGITSHYQWVLTRDQKAATSN